MCNNCGKWREKTAFEPLGLKTPSEPVGLKSPAQPQPAPKPVNDPSGVSRLRSRDSRARAPVCIERVSRTSWLARLARSLGRGFARGA